MYVYKANTNKFTAYVFTVQGLRLALKRWPFFVARRSHGRHRCFAIANNNLARDEGTNFSEKFYGGVKHLNTSNSVATQQCISELGIVLAAPSFLLRGILIGMKRKKVRIWNI